MRTGRIPPKHKKILLYFLIGVFALTAGPVAAGFTDNEIVLTHSHLKLTGLYGEKIPLAELAGITLLTQRPGMSRRIQGYALGSLRKGYFEDTEKKKVKLLINREAMPWILIVKKNGDRIYFSAKRKSNQVIHNRLLRGLDETIGQQ